ncbi:hypothetical protein OR099_001801, partial [Campylobacter jejuni]|nr:hypothetical protein [Campylobacter jejuni]
KQEVVTIKKHEKLEIFKNLSQEDQEISFVKIEILNYDSNEDSLSFNLDIFPSGMSYKYGILKGSMHIILQGKTSSTMLFPFLKSMIYKNKSENSSEKNFTLMINQKKHYKLIANLS